VKSKPRLIEYYIFQYNSFGLLKCHLEHSVTPDGHSKTPFGQEKCRLALLRGLLAIFFPAQSFSRAAQRNNHDATPPPLTCPSQHHQRFLILEEPSILPFLSISEPALVSAAAAATCFTPGLF
jgi:hypothetical protein